MFLGELYDFQTEARDAMTERGNLLLALVMGAGKTPTTIASIEELVELGEVATGLVVCPSNLKWQWSEMIYEFTGRRPLVISGPKMKRVFLYSQAPRFRYSILSYESVLSDYREIRAQRYDFVVLDEATAIKGFRSKRSRAVKALGRYVDYRYALTGQPIENRPEELYSIMEFVDPEVLGGFRLFDRTFIVRDHWGKPERYRNLHLLNKRMKTAMYRRTREDLKGKLPRIQGFTMPVRLDMATAKLYRLIARDLAAVIRHAMENGLLGSGFDVAAHYGHSPDGQAAIAQGKIMNRFLALRMLCDHPELVRISARLFKDGNVEGGSQYAAELLDAGMLQGLTKSPKLDAFRDHVTAVLEADPRNKLVIFSGFVAMCGFIHDTFKDMVGTVMFTGKTSAKEKERSRRSFQTDPDTRIFVSSEAGGYGLNLDQANHLMSVDLPFSAGRLDQRESRIIRLSTRWSHVDVGTFLVHGSIEQRIFDALVMKRGINAAFVDGEYDSKGAFQVTLGSLTEFLDQEDV